MKIQFHFTGKEEKSDYKFPPYITIIIIAIIPIYIVRIWKVKIRLAVLIKQVMEFV